MKFFIPAVGTIFELQKPWEFLLYAESRNESLFKAFGSNVDQLVWEPVSEYFATATGFPESVQEKLFKSCGEWGDTKLAAKFSLPPGTVLKIDRVYVRSGQGGDFDSVTLNIRDTTHPFLLYSGKNKSGKKKTSLGRFWVKLCDFNMINAKVIENTVKSHI